MARPWSAAQRLTPGGRTSSASSGAQFGWTVSLSSGEVPQRRCTGRKESAMTTTAAGAPREEALHRVEDPRRQPSEPRRTGAPAPRPAPGCRRPGARTPQAAGSCEQPAARSAKCATSGVLHMITASYRSPLVLPDEAQGVVQLLRKPAHDAVLRERPPHGHGGEAAARPGRPAIRLSGPLPETYDEQCTCRPSCPRRASDAASCAWNG